MKDVQTVAVIHLYVQDDQIRFFFFNCLEKLVTALRRGDLVSGFLQFLRIREPY